MTIIVSTHRILPLPGRREDVLELLRSILGPVLVQPGCLSCRVLEERRDGEEAVVLVERWESEEALEAHLRSEAYRRILGAIELSGDPPEIRFDHVSDSEEDGIERVMRSRLPDEDRGSGSAPITVDEVK